MARLDPEFLKLQIAYEKAVIDGLDELAEQIAALMQAAGGSTPLRNPDGILVTAGELLTTYFVAFSSMTRDVQVEIARDLSEKVKDAKAPDLKRAGAKASYRRKFNEKLDAYPKQVNDRFYQRPGPDGKTFAHRIVTVRKGTEQTVRNIAQNGVERGESARQIAEKVRAYLKPEYAGRRPNAYQEARDRIKSDSTNYQSRRVRAGHLPYSAMRIARTESAHTYRKINEETLRDTVFEDRMEWLLSNRHPMTDICNDLAKKTYKVGEVPDSHPNCLCLVRMRAISIETLAKRLEGIGMLL